MSIVKRQETCIRLREAEPCFAGEESMMALFLTVLGLVHALHAVHGLRSDHAKLNHPVQTLVGSVRGCDVVTL